MPAYASLDTIIRNLRVNWGGSDQGEFRDWSDRTSVDFAFPTFGARGSEADGVVAMSATQKTYARLAFELWDDIIALDVHETTASSLADIQFHYSSSTIEDRTYARTVEEDSGTNLARAYIWLNANWEDHDEDTDIFFGSYGFGTYLHEIGHALGLTHPGPYDESDSARPTYADDALYAQDTQKYTVMSYFDAWEDGSTTYHWGSDGMLRYAATPLLHDIAAMQAIYGADMTTRTGDTVYGFYSNAGKTFGAFTYNSYDFVQNPNPIFAIWDAGGTDTIDASGFSTNQHISLAEGTFSSIGSLTDNISIAFGAQIENAIGGRGDDEIRGNGLDNRLDGRQGNDNLIAGGGVDTLLGGSGDDVLWGSGSDILMGGEDDDTYYVTLGDRVTEYAGQGWDTVNTELPTYSMTSYVEELLFSNPEFDPSAAHSAYGNAQGNRIVGAAGVDTFYGNGGIDNLFGREGNDILNGGALGDNLYGEAGADTLRGDDGADRLEGGLDSDRLYGGTGNDRLIGGDGKDILNGGADADIFQFNSTADSWELWLGLSGIDSVDTITDFVHGVDIIDLSRIDANTTNYYVNDAFTLLSKPASLSNWTAKVWTEQFIGIGGASDTTVVYASTDADAAAEFQINLTGRVTLTVADFML
jgi:Ca2+-binding RTX toxin-like protein